MGSHPLLAEAGLAKQPYSTINARAETTRTAPTYREPFKSKRCLVLVTGWYEWQKLDAKKKRPIHMCARATPFALAGVYECGRATAARPSPALPSSRPTPRRVWPSITNRMPVVLDDSQFDEWMRGTPDQAGALMKPYAGEIEAWEVRAEVGNVNNNRPELIERVGLL